MTEKLTLSELQQIIRDSLYISLPDMYWISAEISEIKENYSGHCYLELIEKQADEKNIRARIRAIIWCKRYNFIKSYFENVTGETLKTGLKILIRAKIEYHELFGLSLDICDIDPVYTIGEQSAKRQRIIRQLEEEGVFDMNRILELPLSVQRIAVISSQGAAGYSDFIKHLSQNNYGYVFYTKLFETPVQGNETEQGVIRALDRIAEHHHLFDVVVIIRGGGSRVDLSWFDSYNIAYHITQFPLPVMTGIGHEKDMSVTDMVACMALKTPTAVADYLIEHMAGVEKHLSDLWSGIQKISELILEKNRKIIETSGLRLLPLTRILISRIRDMLSEKIIRLVNKGNQHSYRFGLVLTDQNARLVSDVKNYLQHHNESMEKLRINLTTGATYLISSKKNMTDVLEKTLSILKPENILRRGFTITSGKGIIIKSKKIAEQHDIIQTLFFDGSVTSRVIDNGSDEINS